MEVIDLAESHKPTYLACLEDWEDFADAGDRKERWYEAMSGKGLRVKLALDDDGTPRGMIQYAPIEHSFAQGASIYLIYCVWVLNQGKGRQNFQKKGMGKALLAAAEEDARRLGAKGMAAWGVALPFWMKASWYRKRGYRNVDRNGIARLVWKPFSPEAEPPRWIRRRKKPDRVPGQVTVTCFNCGWCQAQNLVAGRAKRAAYELGDRVVFREFNTLDRDVLNEWGTSDALYIDGKEVSTGPPPSYEKIKALIGKKLARLS
jgi:GNAT superfamily N-acetyltransferase